MAGYATSHALEKLQFDPMGPLNRFGPRGAHGRWSIGTNFRSVGPE